MSDQVAFKNLFLNHVVPETVFKEVIWRDIAMTMDCPGPELGDQSHPGGLRQALHTLLPERNSQGEQSNIFYEEMSLKSNP